MLIPRTLLSLLYHSTVPRYRDEMHLAVEQAAICFAIDDEAFGRLRQRAIPSASDVRFAIEATDIAAFKLRSRQNNAAEEMRIAANRLFDCLAPLLAAELAGLGLGTHKEPDQPATGSGGPYSGLLKELYLLVYSSEYRSAQAAPLIGDDEPWRESWTFVRRALLEEPQSYEQLLPHTKRLCDQLSDEFCDSVWPAVW